MKFRAMAEVGDIVTVAWPEATHYDVTVTVANEDGFFFNNDAGQPIWAEHGDILVYGRMVMPALELVEAS